jgi:hypothetical protein
MVKDSSQRGGEGAGTLERRAKELFDQSVERLDARTRSKLTRARNAALDELNKSQPRLQWLRGPAAGLVAATVLAAVVILWPRGGQMPETATLPLEDFDIVADAENLDMLEDVEFYAWLDEPVPGDANRHSG